MILDDPLGYSFIWREDISGLNVAIEEYERTEEQDDDFGITQLKEMQKETDESDLKEKGNKEMATIPETTEIIDDEVD